MAKKNSFLDFFKKNKSLSGEASPEGYCPNCWGRQEYGGEFYEAVRNYSHDVDAHDPHDGWVLDYAKKHLDGIQLVREDDHKVCQNCKVTYRLES
ncbi:hypothetical protein [Robiginitalea aurantiaca]|uniref:HNH endonuclease n=1 Tax=Robiginitalea aurantiaca TaxID=3056915 RepID=A0ABT7WCP6_9FLAO|nr:hypothetical protein [Robiginitalea aurantiaca]MDM9630685.1 hypothetical protein [Robiginitalea aurantiaca]